LLNCDESSPFGDVNRSHHQQDSTSGIVNSFCFPFNLE